MDNWIFYALPIVGALHIVEEYVFPGGFAKAFREMLPRASHLFTVRFHLAVNGVFFVLCIIGALVGKANLMLSLSVYGLIFANAVLHIRGAILRKGYYPGVATGVLVYIPLAAYAYLHFVTLEQLSWGQAGISFLLGVLYMVVLMISVLGQQKREIDNAETSKE